MKTTKRLHSTTQFILGCHAVDTKGDPSMQVAKFKEIKKEEMEIKTNWITAIWR